MARIQCCCGLWPYLGSYRSNSTPSLKMSICYRCGPKKQKKQKKQKKKKVVFMSILYIMEFHPAIHNLKLSNWFRSHRTLWKLQDFFSAQLLLFQCSASQTAASSATLNSDLCIDAMVLRFFWNISFHRVKNFTLLLVCSFFQTKFYQILFWHSSKMTF